MSRKYLFAEVVSASLNAMVLPQETKKSMGTFRAQAIFSKFAFSWSAFAVVLRSSKMFLSFALVIGGVQCSSQSDALRRASMNRSPSPALVCSDCGAKATMSRARSITTRQMDSATGWGGVEKQIAHEGNDRWPATCPTHESMPRYVVRSARPSVSCFLPH